MQRRHHWLDRLPCGLVRYIAAFVDVAASREYREGVGEESGKALPEELNSKPLKLRHGIARVLAV